MPEWPTETPNRLTQSSTDEASPVSEQSVWPWVIRGAIVLGLAVVWTLLLARPALGRF